jgi:sugar phosphate permease
VRLKLFYGWYIVLAGSLVAAFYGAIFTYGWTAFVGPIAHQFGWSMAQVSLGSSLRSLESGVFNPIFGPMVDRFSPKKLMLSGVIITAAGMLCLSQTKNLPMYYAGFLVSGVGSSLISGMVAQTVIARWFRKDLGKASGLFYTGTALGGVAVSLVVRIIDKIGWDTTLLYASIGFLAIGVPLSFVTRSRPQNYGLLPDGKAIEVNTGSKPVRSYDFSTRARDALKTRAFWYLGGIFLWQFAVFSTVSLYSVPYLTSLGISRTNAGTVVSMFTLVAAIARMPIGMLSDVFKKTRVFAISISMMCAGLFIFWTIDGNSPFWFLALFGIVFGFGLSGLTPLRGPILTEYFGVRSIGTFLGLTSIFTSFAQVTSQPLAGWVYDTRHDYKIWWLALGIAGLVAIVAILTIPASKARTEPLLGQRVG